MKKTFVMLFVASALLSGCTQRKKRSVVSHISHVRSHGKRDLKLDVSCCSDDVCERELGINLTDSGYVMIRLHIVNRGGDCYVFRPSYCDVSRISFDRIAELVYYDTPTRCLWLSVPSFLLWWPAIPLFVVPCGLMWSQWNRQLEKNITQRLIDAETVFKIRPYESIERFMIIPAESWLDTFSIGFFDKSSKELVYFTIAFDEHE